MMQLYVCTSFGGELVASDDLLRRLHMFAPSTVFAPGSQAFTIEKEAYPNHRKTYTDREMIGSKQQRTRFDGRYTTLSGRIVRVGNIERF